jgi:hypothetical protein
LAEHDPVSRINQHGWLHIDVIVTDNCHLPDGITRPDLLLGTAGNWNIESLVKSNCFHIGCKNLKF